MREMTLWRIMVFGEDCHIRIHNADGSVRESKLYITKVDIFKSKDGIPSSNSGYEYYIATVDQLRALVGRDVLESGRIDGNGISNWDVVETEMVNRYGREMYDGIMCTMNNISEFIQYTPHSLLSGEMINERIFELESKIKRSKDFLEYGYDAKVQGAIEINESAIEALRNSDIDTELVKLSNLTIDCLEQDVQSLDGSNREAVSNMFRRLTEYKNNGLIKDENRRNERFERLYQEFLEKHVDKPQNAFQNIVDRTKDVVRNGLINPVLLALGRTVESEKSERNKGDI